MKSSSMKMPVEIEQLKACAVAVVDKASAALNDISQAIWSKPELGFEERHAHVILTDYLEKAGFAVERSYVLDTAFRATYGNGDGPHVAVLCEYDALPGIGHACGHNLIAEVGIAAGLGIKAAMEVAEAPQGKITVMGTPAEESGGGKIKLIKAGCFRGVDCAMMAHPCPVTLAVVDVLASASVKITYKGRASHAAGFPWEGINALDAAVMAYSSISCFRQQMKPTWRVHGVITNGGEKPNIIPEETSMVYSLRTPTMKEMTILQEKAAACFKSAAIATGCTVELEWGSDCYENMIFNATLSALYKANAGNLNIEFKAPNSSLGTGSTDMGNVSHVVPSIHPMFYIGTDAVNHTRQFTDGAGDPKAQPHTLAQGKALAMTAIDVLCNPDLVPKMKQELEKDLVNDQ